MKLASMRIDRYSLFYSRALRWAVVLGVVTMALIGMVLLFLLTHATDNRALYERNYRYVFVLSVVLAVVLLLVVLWFSVRLLQGWYTNRFGSRLLVKLSVLFAVAGILPGVLVYTVSYQFVARSIESWFDVKVEGALQAGVKLARTTLDTFSSDVAHRTKIISAQLADVPVMGAGVILDRIREQLEAVDVLLWDADGKLLASVGESRFALNPEHPSSQILRELRTQQRVHSTIEGLEDVVPQADMPMQQLGNVRIKAIVMVPASTANMNIVQEARYLQVSVPLPPSLVQNALALQTANSEYQERALAREGLRRMYIGTLTLSLFLAVLGALVLAVVLGNQLARPLLVLADGVREVSAGNFSPKAISLSKDELGGLTRSFAGMTQQLAEARAALEDSVEQVRTAHANLQTILDNLAAGVIVLNEHGKIMSANPGATRILKAPLAAYEGQALSDVPRLKEFGEQVQSRFDIFLHDSEQGHELDHWQQTFELENTHSGVEEEGRLTMVVRGAELPEKERLLVFDDISEIVSAQRSRAWADVARRLAHEIKNPLTPIQLAAERMEMKLLDKLPDTHQALLTRSVKTIVNQVTAMKHLVNEFRDYARLPTAQLQPLNLNELIDDVLQLYGEGSACVTVHAELDPECPLILGDAEQLRQVIHNLLQNAQDACEALATDGTPRAITVSTQFVAVAQRVQLRVRDQGSGFQEAILKRAFEPYVTTKTRGTGLGLAVVKKIADEHRARIDLSNWIVANQTQGAQVSVSFPVGSLATGE